MEEEELNLLSPDLSNIKVQVSPKKKKGKKVKKTKKEKTKTKEEQKYEPIQQEPQITEEPKILYEESKEEIIKKPLSEFQKLVAEQKNNPLYGQIHTQYSTQIKRG